MVCGLEEVGEPRHSPVSPNLSISGPQADSAWVATQKLFGELEFGELIPGSDGSCCART